MSIRIVQIGVGIRGGHWTEIVRDHPDTTGVGYVDPDPQALARARAIGGDDKGYFADLDDALQKTSADAALIVSPSPFHAKHAIRALEAGLAVLVEKPLALTVEDASRVLQCAEAAGRPVVVAENYRYWPSERTVRELVQGGRVGEIDSATLIDRRNQSSHTEGPWLQSIDYPQLQEVAIHHFDSLRAFLGLRPTSITARAWNAPWSDYKHGASTEALIEFGDVQVQYLGTMTSHRFSFSLWIEGKDGVIWTNRRYVFWRRTGSRFFRPVRNVKVAPGDEAKYPRGGTTSILNSLRDAVIRGEVPETSGQDNIWNVAMIQAGKLSDRQRRTVPIEEIYRQ